MPIEKSYNSVRGFGAFKGVGLSGIFFVEIGRCWARGLGFYDSGFRLWASQEISLASCGLSMLQLWVPLLPPPFIQPLGFPLNWH